MDPMESIKATFFQECDELLADLEAGLLALESGQGEADTINAVFRAVVLCEGELLQPEDFPQICGPVERTHTEAAEPVRAEQSHAANDLVGVDSAQRMGAYIEQAVRVEAEPAVRIFDEGGHLRALEAIERDLIELAIEHYAGHMSEIARRLGIGRSTLYRKLREYGLDLTRERVRQIELDSLKRPPSRREPGAQPGRAARAARRPASAPPSSPWSAARSPGPAGGSPRRIRPPSVGT